MVKNHAARVGLHNPNSISFEDLLLLMLSPLVYHTPDPCGHAARFVKELRGDARREAIDIYNHIDKKELQESYLAHIPQLGI